MALVSDARGIALKLRNVNKFFFQKKVLTEMLDNGDNTRGTEEMESAGKKRL
jgi:hypothetical protein